MRPLFHLLTVTLFVALGATGARAQALTLLDNFNRADNTTVGNGWSETETAPPASAAIVSNQLKLSSATAGRDFIVRDLSAYYNPVLSANTRRLTWAWNTRQSRTNPSGFDASNYGNAFVLAASSPNLTATTTTGYAVVVGQSSQPDPFRLVYFANGLTANATLTTIFTTATDYGTAYLTLRVSYLPDDNSWTLEASTNTTAFENPATSTTFATLGTGTDATATATALPYLGCLWNHATTASENAVFDNLYVPAPCVTTTEPATGPTAAAVSQLTSTSATLSCTAGTGMARLILLRAGQAPATTPADGTAYPASAAFATSPTLAPNEYAVLSAAATSVALTNLQPATAYFFAAYDYNGTGCTTSYRQAGPLTGSFTTPACTPAARPTAPATQATATTAPTTGSLTFSWTNGNGTARLVVVRPTQPVAATPTDATAYTASARYGAGTAISATEYVVFASSGTTVTVSGLTPGTAYYAAIYEYNGTGCAARYLTTTPAIASATVPAAPTAYQFFRGNLHAHSGYSDGNKDASTSGASTPADDFVLARLAQQFDFLGISEHNHAAAGMALPDYVRGLTQADAATQDGTFVALYGMEWGTISGGGHVIIYGYPQLIGWEAGNYDVYCPKNDYTALFSLVAQRPGAFAYLAHPQSTDYNGLFTNPLNATTARALVGSAMRSGPAFSTATDYSDPSTSNFETRFKDALKRGYHVGPTLDHDNHYSVFGRSTYGRTVALAPVLTRAALLDAFQQRRFYASDDDDVVVTLKVGTQPMGSVLTQAGPPTLTVAVTDPDAGDAVSTIALFAGVPGSGTVATQLTSSTGSATLSYTDPIPDLATYYYYAVITQVDGDKIWTAPIRYTRNNATPLPVTLTRFQAVLQNESQAVLRWATASEQHSAYFAVERSANGHTFTEIGRLPAAGTSSRPLTYELRDPQPLTAPAYYRLRQTDTDQTTAYSPVIVLTPAAREPAQANIYPNPATGTTTFHLALRGTAGQPLTIRVTDLLGRPVFSRYLLPDAYLTDVPLRLPTTTTPGTYLVTATTGPNTWTMRWTLQP